MKQFVLLMAVAILFALPAISTAETVTAYFDDGNTTSEVDGFVGMAGDGWAGPWGEWWNKIAPAPHTNYVVRTSDETETYDDPYVELVPGSGNYLYADVNVSDSSGGSGGFERNYAGTNGIDLTKPYTIDFLYRIEEDAAQLAGRFTDVNDRYTLFDYPTARTGATTGCGWIIAAHGGVPSSGWLDSEDVGDWLFYDGKGHLGSPGAASENWVNTGIAIAAGQTLSFHLEIDPANKKWNATVTDLANPSGSFTQTGMGWRIDTTAATGDPNAVLSGLTQFKGQGSSSNDERRFSVDSIVVQQIPEPGFLVMSLGVMLMGLMVRRRS